MISSKAELKRGSRLVRIKNGVVRGKTAGVPDKHLIEKFKKKQQQNKKVKKTNRSSKHRKGEYRIALLGSLALANLGVLNDKAVSKGPLATLFSSLGLLLLLLLGLLLLLLLLGLALLLLSVALLLLLLLVGLLLLLLLLGLLTVSLLGLGLVVQRLNGLLLGIGGLSATK